MAAVCSHCRRKKVNRPRGLCWGCYHTPGVRGLYVSDSIYARLGVGLGQGRRPPPAEPTDARPGSDEKIAVMAARAAREELLHHDDDAKGWERTLNHLGG